MKFSGIVCAHDDVWILFLASFFYMRTSVRIQLFWCCEVLVISVLTGSMIFKKKIPIYNVNATRMIDSAHYSK